MSDVNLDMSGKPPESFLRTVNQQGQQPAEGTPPAPRPPRQKGNGMIDTAINEKLAAVMQHLDRHKTEYSEVLLPSMGKFYDGTNGPKDGIVRLRKMTGEEEDVLGQPRQVRSGSALNLVYNQCMQDKRFKAEDFLAQDRTFMLLWLRAHSYNQFYEIEVRDPETDQRFTHTVDLAQDVPTTYCPEDFGPEKLEGVFPHSEMAFRYRLMTGRDEVRLLHLQEERGKMFNSNYATNEIANQRLALLLDWIDGPAGRIDDKDALAFIVKQLPGGDRSHLRWLQTNPPFGSQTKVTVFNPYTYSEFEVELPLGPSFFSPRAGTGPARH